MPPESARRWNRSNTRGRSSGGDALARVAHDEQRRRPRPSATSTVTEPPAGVWRSAFATRLPRISRTRTGSTLGDDRRVARRPQGHAAAQRREAPWAATASSRERREVRRLAVERQRAGLGERQRPEVVEQPVHHRGLGEERREVVLVHRVDAVDHGLEAALRRP